MKLNVKKRYRFKKAALYERKVIKSKNFYSPAEASILIQHVVSNRSLKATYYATTLISSFYTCNKISMTLHRSLEYTHTPQLQVYNEIQTTNA
jgi:hypothetical protein